MRAAIVLLGAALALVGCGEGSSGGTPGDASTNADGGVDSGASSDAAADSGPASGDACSRFVACSTKVQPDTTAATLAAYGPDGACWKTQTKQACEDACKNAIPALHALAPSEPACALCVSDQDCSAPTPVCSPATGACAQCKSAADCSAPLAACDTASGTCVACASSADCSAPLAACDTATHKCVECTGGAECSSGRCESDHTCCEPVAPCNADSCGTLYDNCGKAVSCGDCPTNQFCNTNSYCEPITDTFACNAGGKNNTCTKDLQYCQYYFAGPGGTTAWCSTVPAACQANPTCACLQSAGEFFPPDTCSEGTGPNGKGAVYVTSKP